MARHRRDSKARTCFRALDARYSLLKDSDSLGPSHFIAGDIFSEEDQLSRTRDTWDMIHVTMFLHVFTLPEQIAVNKNIIKSKHLINVGCP